MEVINDIQNNGLTTPTATLQTSQVFHLDTGFPIHNSLATLHRTEDEVESSLDTKLSEGAYTKWWVGFNNPEFCVDGCDAGDLENPAGTVYLSGQAAFDVEENVIGINHKEQMQQCLRNIQAGLEAVGGSLGDVVSLRIYVVDYNPDAESDLVTEGLKQFFDRDRLPASTWIGVSTLAVKDFLVEIEATAVLE